MTNRQLTKEEIELCNAQIKRLGVRNDYLNYLSEYNMLMIEKGLRLNYEEQMHKFKDDLKELTNELKFNQEKIDVMLKQIKEGVPEKNTENKLVG